MAKFLLLLLAFSTFFILSCEKQDPECFIPAPSFSINGQEVTEDTITLDVLNNGIISLSTPPADGFEFLWRGPNGFESTLINPIITNVTNEMSGVYTLRWTKGICWGEASTNVVLNVVNIPCTPQNNRLTFTEGLSPVNFSTIFTSTNTGVFRMTMNGSGGDLYINFANASAPQTGIYSINPDCPTSFINNGEICMSLTYSGAHMVADSGNVYITKLENGKYTVLFCNIKFNPSASLPFEIIGSALITQN